MDGGIIISKPQIKKMKLTKARALVSEYDMNKNESAVVGRNLQW